MDQIRQALAIGKQEPSKFSYLVLLLEHIYWFATLTLDRNLSAWIAEEALRVADEVEYPERSVLESYGAWAHALSSGCYHDAIEMLNRTIGLEKERRRI